jgi:OsmC-like protein
MLSGYDAHPAGAPDAVQWSARARLTRQGTALVYARDHALTLSCPVSFKPAGDAAPSALDTLLCALAGELVTGLTRRASRRGLTLDACEALVSCSLENPLVAAGVVGEEGSPALAALTVTLFVATPDPETTLQKALAETLAAAPVYTTLRRACPITLTLKLTL